MKFASAFISAIAAATAVSAYGNSNIFARDLAELDARDAYELGFLHARSLFEDDEFELYTRALNRPGHPTLPAGTIAKANSDYQARLRTGTAQHAPASAHDLPAGYKPHRPGTPNPNTSSFFSAADTAAVHRGSSSRYRRSLYDEYDY